MKRLKPVPRRRKKVDPVSLEVFKHLFSSIAEEMGTALRRSTQSPNIRDRLDFSCALFDERCRLVAQAAHIPVHLGSMHFAVRETFLDHPPRDETTWILNDPYRGGTHLPDITLVTPLCPPGGPPLFYVASRAHHADVGGASGGSMGVQRSVFAEGLRIPPTPLVSPGGKWNADLLGLLRANVRDPETFQGDLMAQYAANRTGILRVRQYAERHGLATLVSYARHLQRYSALRMRRSLAEFPRGTFHAEDLMEDDGAGNGPVRIHVTIGIRPRSVLVDFTGTDPQVEGPINTPLPVTWSCVQYVFRTLTDPDIPNNSGCFEPIRLVAPVGTLVNASWPAAVAAGNVETSQRIVDCLYRALAEALPDAIPAASCGSMNNLSISGIHPATGNPFCYYETIAGGMGARPGRDGLSGVHTHMTNTRNTPVEVLESAFPLRVERYALRKGSGGRGRFRGGDGIVRCIRLLTEVTLDLLGERRRTAPYGLHGGEPGARGEDLLVGKGGRRRLPAKGSTRASTGDLLCIKTPGGGGWGRPEGTEGK